ncbi:MAG: glycosyltransferase [Microbacteriaceae bacterium]|nr:glycosyltransferase [Microbacteriaceae bacterium]
MSAPGPSRGDARGRRILLVTPDFHGYWRAIAAALARRGHEVRVHRYDAATAPHRRLENRLAHRGGAAGDVARRRKTDRAIAALRETAPEAVLVVKGDLLGDAWWEALDASGAPRALWLYDELDRMPYTPQRLAELGPVASYSPSDVAELRAAGVRAVHLANAFDSLARWRPRPTPAVTFVGARYAERERAVGALAAAGVPVTAFGREWSRHPIDVLRTGRRDAPPAGVGAGRDLPREEYYGVMAGSLATLNVHGDAHEGFSMRTFEAPGVGAVQLIDRPDVAEHYEPGREVLVFEHDDELVALAERVIAEPEWARGIAEAGRRRTLAEHTFVDRLAIVEDLWR